MVNHPKFNNGGTAAVPGTDDENTKFLRMPFGFVMLSDNNTRNGKEYDGSVMINHGDDKKEKMFLSYMDMKKIIDFCRENKDLFNKMMRQEKEKISTSGDLE